MLKNRFEFWCKQEMGPGIIRHLKIWWSIARIAGIWHRLNYFDNISRPGILGLCNSTAVYLLWPMDDVVLKDTARHEAFHLSLLAIDVSGRWEDIEVIRDEAMALALAIPALADILNVYQARGLHLRDEPLVLLADAMANNADLAELGASRRLVALVQTIVRPKPLMPVLRAGANVVAAVGMTWAIIAGIMAG